MKESLVFSESLVRVNREGEKYDEKDGFKQGRERNVPKHIYSCNYLCASLYFSVPLLTSCAY